MSAISEFGIPLPYSITTLSPLLAFHDALVYQVLSKSDHCRRSYHVISIFKVTAAETHFTSGFGLGDVALFTKVKVYRQTEFS